MLDTNNKTVHFDKAQYERTHPSLLPLRAALIAAEREVPSSPDVNGQLAETLIARMKTEYKNPLSFTSWKDDKTLNSFNLQEVIGSNV